MQTRLATASVPAGTFFSGPVYPGDRLVRASPHEGILHSAVVLSDRIETAGELARRGVPVEAAGPGGYVEVLETPLDGGPERSVGRRLVDRSGRMPHGQVLVPAPEAREPGAYEVDDRRSTAENFTPIHGPGTGDVLHPTNASGVLLLATVRREVARQAHDELRRWRTDGGVVREGDPQGRTILAADYWPAAGVANPSATFGGSWWSARAWSAAFVSHTVNAAAARLGLADLLRGAPSHMRYAWQAYRDRIARRVERYWAYPPDRVLVEVGDIVVKGRGTGNAATWSDLTSPTYVFKQTHGDLVVAVTPTAATVIGGNLGNTVDQRSYPLASRFIDTNSTSYAANRVFAVLKLVGAAA